MCLFFADTLGKKTPFLLILFSINLGIDSPK